MLWKHGLLFVHVVGSLGRNPSGLYWFGGVVSWLAAVAVDVADPGVTCETIVCVLAALQAQAAADPKLLLHNMMRMCMRSSRVFALDVVLPGLLLTWLELRARRAWWQQQQARQQQALRQLRSEAAANKKQQAAAAAVASAQAAAGPSSRTAVTQPQAKRILRQQQQQQQPVSTGNHKPGVHCDPSRQAANQLPVQAETAAAAASTQAPQPASSPAVAAAAALAAAPAGAVQVQAGAALSLPAAAAEMLPAALPGPRRGSVLYRSPVQRSIVSLKFSKAPGPGKHS
jgi:pyruvate/2-oxoglutarate dehydrogenase complex dihydrolipoamide acyltransferase (E2) component